MKHAPLLIEILTEELPAIPFLKEHSNIIPKWHTITQKYHITSNPTLYFTPRRIVIYDEAFPTQSEAEEVKSYGPPLQIAYIDGDKTKGLSKAGESFYKKLNLDSHTLESIKLNPQTATKDGKEVLYFAMTKKGQNTKELLALIIKEWLQSLSFGKSMFWGDLNESFIRPVRNIFALFDEVSLDFELFGLKSKAQTFLHRDVSFEPCAISGIKEYFSLLENNKVILDQNKRKAMILEQIEALEKTYSINVEIDSSLLEEVVAITEYPHAAFGSFDKDFLRLPSEVIITSMKENQRYFATYKDSKLYNGFVLVSNSSASNLAPIVAGNQKVLKARLSDAVFFYENDLKNGFMPQNLEKIMFVEGLGTLLDKQKRENAIALELLRSYATYFDMPITQAQTLLESAITYAKADLLTEMVYEFTELQGIMGYYYAKAFGMDNLVCEAIRDQYLPTGEDSALPSHLLGAIVALSIKLDNIFSLFSINKLPTGSKDPFALRRGANGVIKILQAFNLPFDLSTDLERLYNAGGYKKSDIKRIEAFFIERLDGILKINPSILRSVLKSNAKLDINSILSRAQALNVFLEKSDKAAFSSLFKRVANILDASESSLDSKLDTSLLLLESEKALYAAMQSLQEREFSDIYEHLKALFALSSVLETFFDSVLVNDPNPALKANRQALISKIYEEFLRIGDMKEISF